MSYFSHTEFPKCQRISSRTTLLLEVRNTLSISRFVDSIRSAPTKANSLADSFAGHSFHIGAATTTASAGICDSSISL